MPDKFYMTVEAQFDRASTTFQSVDDAMDFLREIGSPELFAADGKIICCDIEVEGEDEFQCGYNWCSQEQEIFSALEAYGFDVRVQPRVTPEAVS